MSIITLVLLLVAIVCNVNNVYCMEFSDLGMEWNSAQPIAGKAVCVQWLESSDPSGTWLDNFLCMDIDIGMKFSSAGGLSGYVCISVNESAEPPSTTWNDNYICVPHGSCWAFSWHTAGKPFGYTNCIQIEETADPHTWDDNYLCGYYLC